MPGAFWGGEGFELALVYGLNFADCIHGGVMLFMTFERLWEGILDHAEDLSAVGPRL